MTLSPLSLRERRHSWAGFFLDHVFFSIGLTFVGTTTILPAFAARLTDNPILIGLVGVLWMGGWTLPQIFAAHYLAAKSRKMPIAIFLGWIGRPVFAVFALYLFLGPITDLSLALVFLYLAVFFFSFIDSIVGVAWLDVLGKVLNGRERGRLLGLGQTGSGLLAIFVGLVIRWVLESPDITFPKNYAILFLLADAAFLISLGACYLIREPEEPVVAKRQPMAEYLPNLIRILQRDPVFLRVNLARLLVGLSALAAPFFAVYAIRDLGLAEGSIGLFAIAQTIGLALAGILFGAVAHRSGSHSVIRIVGGIYLLAPVFAILAGSGGGTEFRTGLLSVSFLFLGMGDGAILMGFLNYAIEIAPSGQRPVYIGLTNTLAGLTIIYPFLGGWFAGLSGYRIVFALAAAGIAAGWFLGWALPDPQRHLPPASLEASSPPTTDG